MYELHIARIGLAIISISAYASCYYLVFLLLLIRICYNSLMLIVLHVILASLSLILAVMNYFAPVKRLLALSYVFASGTLTSGVLLIIFNDSSIIRTCLTGIVFFAAVSTLNELARTRLPELDKTSF